jgi:hypothetical protein
VALNNINSLIIELVERRFSGGLKKMPDVIKRKRLQMLLEFNNYTVKFMLFIEYNTKLSLKASARLNTYFMKEEIYIYYIGEVILGILFQ